MESEILRLNEEQLVTAKENINALFVQCIETLGNEHQLRVVYALQVAINNSELLLLSFFEFY